MQDLAPNAVIVATADSAKQLEELKKCGADEVLLPYTLIGENLTWILLEIYGKNK